MAERLIRIGVLVCALHINRCVDSSEVSSSEISLAAITVAPVDNLGVFAGVPAAAPPTVAVLPGAAGKGHEQNGRRGH